MSKQTPKKIKTDFSNTSLTAQRARLLEALRRESLTTLFCRKKLSIMHPGGRVLELRKQGHQIITYWTKEVDSNGNIHRIARYVLFSQAGVHHDQ